MPLVAIAGEFAKAKPVAQKQTRRSVSLNGRLHELFKAKCDLIDVSMSAVVEAWIADFLGVDSVPDRRGNETTRPVAGKGPLPPRPATPMSQLPPRRPRAALPSFCAICIDNAPIERVEIDGKMAALCAVCLGGKANPNQLQSKADRQAWRKRVIAAVSRMPRSTVAELAEYLNIRSAGNDRERDDELRRYDRLVAMLNRLAKLKVLNAIDAAGDYRRYEVRTE